MPYNSKKMTHVDGTMHHLGVDESHIAKKVILVPDPLDVPILAECLENAEKKGDYREYVTYTGTFDGKPLTVMSCGFGCMPMAIAVEELAHLGATDIIKIGACPAVCKDASLGDIKIAKGAVRGEGVTKEYIDPCYPAVSDMKLLSALLNAIGGDNEPVLFRSHDCIIHESPSAPGGRERMNRWADMGIEIMDSETSALFVIGGILKLHTASAAVVCENFVSGAVMTEAERISALKNLFILAASAHCCG